METSAAVLQVQNCSCPSKFAASAHRGRADNIRQRVESNFFAGSRQELGAPVIFNLSRRRSSKEARCLYSPLVESFEATNARPLLTDAQGNDAAAIRVSPSGLSLIKPAVVVEARQEQAEEQMEAIAVPLAQLQTEQGDSEDTVIPVPEDPVAAAAGDSAVLVSASDPCHELEARKTARYRQPQTMSLTQGFRTAVQQGGNYAVGVAGRPGANAGKIKGPAGLFMGLAMAGLGIATALQKASDSQPQKLCSRCDGYGVECCDVCSGTGKIAWEGKAHRMNACPRCFGSCLKKCPRCDGCRAKKDSTPVLEQLRTSSESS